MGGRSKAARWRRMWRAVRYDERCWKATRGSKPILCGYRTRAVDGMSKAYPNWPFNANGNVRGWRL